MNQLRFDFLTRMKQSSKQPRLSWRRTETETKLAEDPYEVLFCEVAQAPDEISQILPVGYMHEVFALCAAFIGDRILHSFNRPLQLIEQGLDIVRVQAELKAFTQAHQAFSVLLHAIKHRARPRWTERIMKLNHLLRS